MSLCRLKFTEVVPGGGKQHLIFPAWGFSCTERRSTCGKLQAVMVEVRRLGFEAEGDVCLHASLSNRHLTPLAWDKNTTLHPKQAPRQRGLLSPLATTVNHWEIFPSLYLLLKMRESRVMQHVGASQAFCCWLQLVQTWPPWVCKCAICQHLPMLLVRTGTAGAVVAGWPFFSI